MKDDEEALQFLRELGVAPLHNDLFAAAERYVSKCMVTKNTLLSTHYQGSNPPPHLSGGGAAPKFC